MHAHRRLVRREVQGYRALGAGHSMDRRDRLREVCVAFELEHGPHEYSVEFDGACCETRRERFELFSELAHLAVREPPTLEMIGNRSLQRRLDRGRPLVEYLGNHLLGSARHLLLKGGTALAQGRLAAADPWDLVDEEAAGT